MDRRTNIVLPDAVITGQRAADEIVLNAYLAGLNAGRAEKDERVKALTTQVKKLVDDKERLLAQIAELANLP